MRSVLIITVCAMLAACGGAAGGPEQGLREWVDAAEAAAEEKDRRGLLGMMSDSYSDTRGNDIDAIDGMLRYYFLRQQLVALSTSIQEIKVSGGTAADIFLTVAMAGTNERAMGFSADAYKFHFELELDDDEWLLVSARWAELGQELR